MKLLVQSKTGRPRRRGPFLFDVTPTVIDIDPEREWPEDSAESREAGLWPPKLNALGEPEAAPRKLIDMINDDTDQYDRFGRLTRSGGLFVREVGGDFKQDDGELAKQNAALQAEVESLRSQIQAREAKTAQPSTGARERTARQTSEDFGSSGVAPRAPATGGAATRSTALTDEGSGGKKG